MQMSAIAGAKVNFTLASFFLFFHFVRHCFAFFLCFVRDKLLLPIALYHLSADDETSNVLKRSVKNVRSRFGSLLYIIVIS